MWRTADNPADNHNFMCHIGANEFFNSKLLTKYQIFYNLSQISHVHIIRDLYREE